MLDGAYEVKAKTPLGKKKGPVIMVTERDVCLAELTVAGKSKRLLGHIDEGYVTFEGAVHVPVYGDLNYDLTGTVRDDNLEGVCRTKKFSFEVRGTRIA